MIAYIRENNIASSPVLSQFECDKRTDNFIRSENKELEKKSHDKNRNKVRAGLSSFEPLHHALRLINYKLYLNEFKC